MKTLLLYIAISIVALAQVSHAAPDPKPGKIKEAVSRVGHKMEDKASCLAQHGVPQGLLMKAVSCAPMAFMTGPPGFAACAGFSSISDARKAVSCFKEPKSPPK